MECSGALVNCAWVDCGDGVPESCRLSVVKGLNLSPSTALKLPQSIEFSNIRRYGRICPIRLTLPASIRFLVSNPLAKPGRTGNPVQMNRVVDVAAVAGEIKIIMHSGG